MHQMRPVVASHTATFAMGSLYLAWLALPVGEGQWRIDPTIHWWWLLVPAALLGVAAGVCQGLVVGFGRFWPTIVPLVPASAAALWSAALFTAPSLFGSKPEQPSPALLIAAVTGWALYVTVALLMTLGVGRAVAVRRTRRADRAWAPADLG